MRRRGVGEGNSTAGSTWLCVLLGRDDADLAAACTVVLKPDPARNFGEESIVFTQPDVESSAEPPAALAHKNRSPWDDVAVVPFDAEALRIAVAAVP
jgi:hypothetical protein